MTPIERFMSKVRVQEGCWEWTGRLTPKGYGDFDQPHPAKTTRAHRWLWCALYGAVPDGLELDHLCCNRSCVRSDHLEPVLHVVNVSRGLGPPANNARKTHCKHGHEFTPENTYKPGGWPEHWRKCRTCALVQAKVAKARRREVVR